MQRLTPPAPGAQQGDRVDASSRTPWDRACLIRLLPNPRNPKYEQDGPLDKYVPMWCLLKFTQNDLAMMHHSRAVPSANMWYFPHE